MKTDKLDEAALAEALKAIDAAKRRAEPYGYVIKRPEAIWTCSRVRGLRYSLKDNLKVLK